MSSQVTVFSDVNRRGVGGGEEVGAGQVGEGGGVDPVGFDGSGGDGLYLLGVDEDDLLEFLREQVVHVLPAACSFEDGEGVVWEGIEVGGHLFVRQSSLVCDIP